MGYGLLICVNEAYANLTRRCRDTKGEVVDQRRRHGKAELRIVKSWESRVSGPPVAAGSLFPAIGPVGGLILGIRNIVRGIVVQDVCGKEPPVVANNADWVAIDHHGVA